MQTFCKGCYANRAALIHIIKNFKTDIAPKILRPFLNDTKTLYNAADKNSSILYAFGGIFYYSFK